MSLLADLLRDCRYSAGALTRTPRFTVAAVIVLALGIGANSAICSLVSAVWLKPLPFTDAERLTHLRAVISAEFWLRRLAGDPAAVGRTTDLDGSPHMVVGGVPRDFRFSRSKRSAWYSRAKCFCGNIRRRTPGATGCSVD